MSKKLIFAALAGFMAFSSLIVLSTSVKAADSVGNVTVSPISFELYANPGETLTEKLRVRNDSNMDNSYSVLVEDFKAVGEEGSVDLIDDDSNTSYSLAKWVVPEPKNFSLKKGEEIEIPYSINVPTDAEPGGHYGSVVIRMGGSDKVTQGASVASKVGSLVLLRVAGTVKEDASVESFRANKSYYQNSPVNFELRLKDNGSNHIQPKGTILITNLFGQKVAEIPLTSKNVLPGAIRKMDTEWTFNKLLANRYTATLVANYGQENKTLSATTTFIIFPKPLLIGLIVILLLIAMAIIFKKNIKNFIHKMTK